MQVDGSLYAIKADGTRVRAKAPPVAVVQGWLIREQCNRGTGSGAPLVASAAEGEIVAPQVREASKSPTLSPTYSPQQMGSQPSIVPPLLPPGVSRVDLDATTDNLRDVVGNLGTRI